MSVFRKLEGSFGRVLLPERDVGDIRSEKTPSAMTPYSVPSDEGASASTSWALPQEVMYVFASTNEMP